VMRQLLLSAAGSDEPFGAVNVALTPPTSEALPAPRAGAVVPVVASLSGTGLLKSHSAMVAAEALEHPANSAQRRLVVFLMNCKLPG
jgi:hypothetical protein